MINPPRYLYNMGSSSMCTPVLCASPSVPCVIPLRKSSYTHVCVLHALNRHCSYYITSRDVYFPSMSLHLSSVITRPFVYVPVRPMTRQDVGQKSTQYGLVYCAVNNFAGEQQETKDRIHINHQSPLYRTWTRGLTKNAGLALAYNIATSRCWLEKELLSLAI